MVLRALARGGFAPTAGKTGSRPGAVGSGLQSLGNRNALAAPLLIEVSGADNLAALAVLGTDENGLPESEVEERLAKFGKNLVATERPPTWYALLLRNLRNPFIVVLLMLGLASLLTHDIRTTVVVGVMVVVSVLMRFLSEYRSNRAAEALRTMVRTTATVIRQYPAERPDGSRELQPEKRDVPFESLVPGDLVHLSAGDMVPADLRLISAKDFFISHWDLLSAGLPAATIAR